VEATRIRRTMVKMAQGTFLDSPNSIFFFTRCNFQNFCLFACPIFILRLPIITYYRVNSRDCHFPFDMIPTGSFLTVAQ